MLADSRFTNSTLCPPNNSELPPRAGCARARARGPGRRGTARRDGRTVHAADGATDGHTCTPVSGPRFAVQAWSMLRCGQGRPRIVCSTKSSVFVHYIYTPPVLRGCISGTSRQRTLSWSLSARTVCASPLGAASAVLAAMQIFVKTLTGACRASPLPRGSSWTRMRAPLPATTSRGPVGDLAPRMHLLGLGHGCLAYAALLTSQVRP